MTHMATSRLFRSPKHRGRVHGAGLGITGIMEALRWHYNPGNMMALWEEMLKALWWHYGGIMVALWKNIMKAL